MLHVCLSPVASLQDFHRTAPPSLPFAASFSFWARSDTRLQFVQLRDPRPMTVSAYFHLAKYHPETLKDMTVDDYVRKNLPSTCQWVALRYTVFEGLLASNSSVFWYEDAIADPVGWHFQWMRLAGVQLPVTTLESMAQAAVGSSRSINEHPGGHDASTERTWEDEVSVDVVQDANEVLLAFLPPVLLARWGVN